MTDTAVLARASRVNAAAASDRGRVRSGNEDRHHVDLDRGILLVVDGVGGHAAGVSDEMVLRFEFPERPGALFNFLNKLGGRWNISMFHYRNHGAADGRVVAGLQVPAEERPLVHAALDEIGYPYWDESENPAYRLFLG